jgi:hypothetical protein
MLLGQRLMPVALQRQNRAVFLPGVYSSPSSDADTVWSQDKNGRAIRDGTYRIVIANHIANIGIAFTPSVTANGVPLNLDEYNAGVNSSAAILSGLIAVAGGQITSSEVTPFAARDGVYGVLLPDDYVLKQSAQSAGGESARSVQLSADRGDAIVAIAGQSLGNFSAGVETVQVLPESALGYARATATDTITIEHPRVRALVACSYGAP